MSLEEEQLPPSIRRGGVHTQQEAWGGGSLQESIPEYWSHEEMNTGSMEDIVQEVKIQLMEANNKASKCQHQLQEVEDAREELRVELIAAQKRIRELEREIVSSKQQQENHQSTGDSHDNELAIARQRIEELEQEVQLKEYLLEIQCSSESLDDDDKKMQNGHGAAEHGDEELKKVKKELERFKQEKGGQLEKLRFELEKVKVEKSTLQDELSEVQGEQSRVQEMLKWELDSVKRELQDTQLQLQEAKNDLKSKQRNMTAENGHLHVAAELEREVEATRKEMKQVKQRLSEKELSLEDTLSRLEYSEKELEKVKQELLDLKSKGTPRKKMDFLPVKLEKAMKELKEKELVCEQYKARMQEVEGEKSVVEEDLKDSLEKLSEMKRQLAEETHRRMELDSVWNRDKQVLQFELSEKITAIINLEHEVERYVRDLENKEQAEVKLQREVDSKGTTLQIILEEKEKLAAEAQNLAAETQNLAAENNELKANNEQLMREKEQAEEEIVKQSSKLQARINEGEVVRKELQTRALNAEEACGGFQEEAEKTMEDYHKLLEQFNELNTQIAEIRHKRDVALNQLSKRNDEIKKKDKLLGGKEDALQNMKEYYEKKLKSQEEATNIQLVVYTEDFKKEREARERAVAKLGEQHQLNAELKKKVESLERYNKELRGQLNQQAARHFQAEFAEEYSNPLSPRDAPPGHSASNQGPFRAS